MTATTIQWILIAIISIDFLIDRTLSWLNLNSLSSPVPNELQGVYDAEKYSQSQAYQRSNSKLGLISSSYSFLIMLFVLSSGIFGLINTYLTQFTTDPTLLALSFFGVLFIASDIMQLPFDLYGTFVIESKFGFNKTTPGLYIADKLKGYALAAVIGGIVMFVFMWLVEVLGPNFWIWFWVFIGAIILFIQLFYTSLIVPMFNKLTPLEDGDLKRAIDGYCSKNGFPLSNVFVIDGSKRSTKSNAYFSGLGKQKKVVLFDTLIQNHSIEEIVAVIAHEVGHYQKRHIVQSIFLAMAQMGFTLYILSLVLFNPQLSIALGAQDHQMHLNMVAFAILYTPVSHITSLLMNVFSRKNEFEADKFAADTYGGEHLITALKKLSGNNLSNLTPHPAYVFVHHSHPTLLRRIQSIRSNKG